MNKKNAALLLGLFLAATLFTQSQAQITTPRGFAQGDEVKPLQGQFDAETWRWMQKRWNQYVTHLVVVMKDGRQYSGQLIRVDEEAVLLQLNRQIVTDVLDDSEQVSLWFSDIRDISVKRGGHPYQGLLIGGVAGAPPGIIGGAILAMGWSIIPPIVLGTITTVAGGWIGQKIQQKSRTGHYDFADPAAQSRFVTRLQTRALLDSLNSTDAPLPSPNSQILAYRLSPLIFPSNPWSLSLRTGPLTNRVRDFLMRWYDGYLWGPVNHYYEYQIAIDADLAWRIDQKMQVGMNFSMVPGVLGYFNLDKNDEAMDVSYHMNMSFKQQSLGLYAGYMIQANDRYMSHRLEGSINGGLMISHIYEHFYFQWQKISYKAEGEIFTRTHYYTPGMFLKLDADYYLLPGISLITGLTGYWIKKVQFPERLVLPDTNYGEESIPAYRVQFSNIQAMIGVKVHF